MTPSTRKSRARARGLRKKDQRGVALLLVMSSITLLTIMVVEFQEEQVSDLSAAYAERDALQAEYMARSAGNLSRLFIASEPVMRQSLGILRFLFGGRPVPQLPVWEFSDQVLGAFAGKGGQDGFSKLTGFDISGAKNLAGPEGATFTVQVVDEDAKINLNLAARGNSIALNRFGAAFLGLTGAPAYDPLFEKNDRDGQTSDRATICGALMDWADTDEQRYACDPRNFQGGGGPAGAEDSSYSLLPRPYRPKNAPYDSLEEARLVRGVGDDFFATFIDPEPNNPKKRVMTVWGQGPLNVNTAAPQAVLAVVCGMAPDAQICTDPSKSSQFLTMFGVLRSFTSGMPLFGSPNEFVNTIQGAGQYGKLLFTTIGIPPVKFQSPAEAAKNFTTESKIFSIHAIGEVKGGKRLTRIKIVMVVDFRGAPAIPQSGPGGLGGALLPGQAGPAGQLQPGQQPKPPPQAGVGQATTTDGIAAALQPTAAGQIVYYRIE